MALRDTAIVGYAKTNIVEKSDRDVWEGPQTTAMTTHALCRSCRPGRRASTRTCLAGHVHDHRSVQKDRASRAFRERPFEHCGRAAGSRIFVSTYVVESGKSGGVEHC